MSLPAPIEHVSAGLALLAEQYKTTPVLKAMYTSLANRLNELETAIFQVISAYSSIGTTNTPSGSVLDTIGALVGEVRNGQTDSAFWPTIQARIIANKSRGDANEILQVANFFGVCSYLESNGAWQISYMQPFETDVSSMLRILSLARAAGYRGIVLFEALAGYASPTVWTDAVSGAPAGDGWLGSSTGTQGNPLMTAQQVV